MKEDQNFFEKVYLVTRLIPFGRVTSYGAIAKFVGSPQSSRMVGWALTVSHRSGEPVPAHRVVNRIGLLTGKHHFGDFDSMQELLENEGVLVKNNKVENFQELFWDPYHELNPDLFCNEQVDFNSVYKSK
jgi:methylated-DNA-protein-cysteine methyltransferase related protein